MGNRKRLRWPLFLAAAVLLYLLAHRSSSPQILSRYSSTYTAVLLAYVVGVGALAWFYHRGDWQRVGVFIEQLDRKRAAQLSANHFTVAVVLILTMHVLLVFMLVVPPSEVLTIEPLLATDYAHHFHQVESVVSLLSSDGHHWGYDPSFCAGYPVGTLFDVDMKLVELASFGLSLLGLPVSLAFNLLILTCFLIVPSLLLIAGRNLRLTPLATLATTLFGLALWHFHPMIRGFNLSGMATFVLATYWTLLLVSLIYRFLDRPSVGCWLGVLGLSWIGFMIHITMPLLLAGPVAAVALPHLRRGSWRRVGVLIGALGVAALGNGWWIKTVLTFYHYRVETPFFPALPASRLMKSLVEFGPELALAVMGFWGFARLGSGERRFRFMGMTSVLWFFFLAYLTAPIPILKSTEPVRFVIPLLVFSALGVALALTEERAVDEEYPAVVRYWLPATVLVAFFLVQLLPLAEVGERRLYSDTGRVRELAKWMSENTTRDSRVAFLDRSPGQLSGAKLSFFLDRELIGGPFSRMNLEHAYASFAWNRLGGKLLEELTPRHLREIAERFNIKWLVATNERVCAVFVDLKPAARLLFELPDSKQGPICVFELDIEPSFFLQGSGQVRSDLNRLVVEGATEGEVVLKYHWLPTLATDPPLRLRQFAVSDSPIGFISVENGKTTEFSIFNSYLEAAN